MTMLAKEKFGIKVLDLMKKRKLTQKGLAERLSVTPPAVCYLIHGKLIPSIAQFDTIMEYLQADAKLIAELKELWHETQPNNFKRSTTNAAIFALRCNRGLTREALSAETGISTERLNELENTPGALPLPQEMDVLKGFYNCTADVIYGGFEQIEEPNNLQVSENVVPVMAEDEKSIINISLEVLAHYRGNVPFEDYLKTFADGKVVRRLDSRNLDRVLAVLTCKAREIHFGMKGYVELYLGEKTDINRDSLYIGRGFRGGLSLWERSRNTWRHCSLYGIDNRIGKSIWNLPVLELRFIPEVKN